MNTHERTVTEWSQRIWAASTKTAGAVIALGLELLEAKADLGHGHFGRLFPEHQDAIANPVPFSQNTAERYMRIATTLGPYSAHAQNMPASVRALFRLVRLPSQRRHDLIISGLISPTMCEKDVAALGQSTVAWSLDAAEERLRKAINNEITNATPASAHLLVALLRRLADELEERALPELRDAVRVARDELSVRDAEPGGYKIMDGGTVIASCKSTHAPWYRGLTTYKPGCTALKRRQIDARIDDIEAGKLPTRNTSQTHFAVEWAIKDLARTSPLARGSFAL